MKKDELEKELKITRLALELACDGAGSPLIPGTRDEGRWLELARRKQLKKNKNRSDYEIWEEF